MDFLTWIGSAFLNPWVYFLFLMLTTIATIIAVRNAIWAYKENNKHAFSKEFFRAFLGGLVIMYFVFIFN